MRTVFFLSALATCLAFASPGDKVTFQYNFKTGQTIRTHMDIATTMSMGKMNMTMDTSMHVDEAKPDGSATLTTQMDGGNMNMGGMKMPMPGRGKQFHMAVSKYGKRMEVGNEKNAPAVVVQEFPDHPIAVGESWDGTVQMQAGRTSTNVTAHFTLDSIKTEGGHKLAHVLVVEDYAGDEHGGMKIHATGAMDWDIDRSVPLTAHMEGTQEIGKMTSTFVLDQTTTVEG